MLLSSQGVFSRGVLPWVLCCLPTLGLGDAPSDSMLACTQITSDTARLACFDRAMEEPRKNTAVQAHVVSVSRYMNDRQVFVLDNAQSWQQIELDPDFTAQKGQEVTISGGALGSFWLSTDSRHRTRVKRIR
jgi:hypothetical protein